MVGLNVRPLLVVVDRSGGADSGELVGGIARIGERIISPFQQTVDGREIEGFGKLARRLALAPNVREILVSRHTHKQAIERHGNSHLLKFHNYVICVGIFQEYA